MSFFKKDVFSGSKYCPTLLETVVPRVLNRNSRDFSLMNVDFNRRNCPYVECASSANSTDSDIGVFNGRSVSVNMIG
jgi:hypothetical protein